MNGWQVDFRESKEAINSASRGQTKTFVFSAGVTSLKGPILWKITISVLLPWSSALCDVTTGWFVWRGTNTCPDMCLALPWFFCPLLNILEGRKCHFLFFAVVCKQRAKYAIICGLKWKVFGKFTMRGSSSGRLRPLRHDTTSTHTFYFATTEGSGRHFSFN